VAAVEPLGRRFDRPAARARRRGDGGRPVRNPQHFGALSGYGLIFFRQEDYERAIAWWERALEVNPNMLGVAANLAQARALLRDRRARTI
jgi:tetratricopeptide (TPR) repeat protein